MYVLDMFKRKLALPSAEETLAGRAAPLETATHHFVSGRPLAGPYPQGLETAYFGMGCFWGAERLFWELGEGIHITQVGYQGGETPNATYQEACSGLTGHAEVVKVVHDPAVIPYDRLVRLFFESHDPTQGMRQGNDVGTQYRSAIYWTTDAQREVALRLRDVYQAALRARGMGPITTEIAEARPFYPAEAYHQQYLAKNPAGYCGLKGTGVACPMPGAVA